MVTSLNQEQQIQSFPLPWDRFWARCIDLALHYLISLLIFIISGIGSYVSELMKQTGSSNIIIYIESYIITWAIVSVVFLFYESFFLSFFGATPGKALFHIKVTGSDGKKLSFGTALVRAISVYWFGHYFFLFDFNVFVIGYWFSRLHYKKTGTFRWDKISNSIVSQMPLSPLRRKLFIILAIFCITLRLVGFILVNLLTL